MRTINNQNRVAREINNLGLVGVEAVGDDGTVCVQIQGSRNEVVRIARDIMETVGNISTGDGVQEGEIFINGDDCNIHDSLSDVCSLDFVPN